MNEYNYDNIIIGQKEQFNKQITKEDEEAFRKITGDINPMHCDDEYARNISNNVYKEHIEYGMLTASLLSTMAGVYLPGKYSLIHSIENIKFKKPVYIGDELIISAEVKEKIDTLKLIILKVVIENQNYDIVCSADMKVLVQK